MEELLQSHPQYDTRLRASWNSVQQAVLLHTLILSAVKLAFGIARVLVEDLLNQRGKACGERPRCSHCGEPLESKGLVDRTMKTLIGTLTWKRRVWRCSYGCQIGQVAPLDTALGIQPNQRTSFELQQAACVLAVFVPFGIASMLLKSVCGVEVDPTTIWEWVQAAGKDAMRRLEQELALLMDACPSPDVLSDVVSRLPLLCGGDGVMVPFRPQTGSACGKNVWREVKVGIVARLGHRVTKAGRTVSVLTRRRLVAVLGTIDDVQPRLWFMAVKEGITTAEVVVWLSDGGRGFWRVYAEQFGFYACGILDFYHASQHLWKAAKGWLDGRTTQARQWFTSARHKLRHGAVDEVLDDMKDACHSSTLSAEVRKTLENVVAYLETHQDHIDYEGYKEMGLPIGSGMVESVCKWLIQQRFKCVGMRWSEDGFNHLLHLRLAWVNGSFDDVFVHPAPRSAP